MATKLGRILTYLEQFLPINLLDPLVMWSCEITWQTKKLRLYYHRLIAAKLARSQTYPEGLLSYSHTTINQMILLYHVTIWETLWSTFIRLMATKLDRMLSIERSFSKRTLKLLPTSCKEKINGLNKISWFL